MCSSDLLIATCYETSLSDAITAITGMARDEGVQLSRDVAADIAALTSNDLVLARLEVEKIALYLDATPQEPKEPAAGILALLGAENDEEDLSAMFNAALGGDSKKLTTELAAASATGFSEVGLFRLDRTRTRLHSSHDQIPDAVFCLKNTMSQAHICRLPICV